MASSYKRISDLVEAYGQASGMLGKAKGYSDGRDFAFGSLRGLIADIINQMPEAQREAQIMAIARWTEERCAETLELTKRSA